MKLWLILACALTVGAAAPARAWCEATCVAPAAESQSHCRTHDPGDGTTLSARIIDECPVLESARPPAQARVDVQAALAAVNLPAPFTRTHILISFEGPHTAATVFERCVPLRI